jgi:hypothetical protein
MPSKLLQTGSRWNVEIDGHFPARLQSNCIEFNGFINEWQDEKVRLLTNVRDVVLKMFGPIHKRKRERLEKQLAEHIEASLKKAWYCGSEARLAVNRHIKRGGRYPERDAAITAAVNRLMPAIDTTKSAASQERARRAGLEKACRRVELMKKFFVNDDGKNMMTWSGIRTAYTRANPRPKKPK